MSAVQWPFPDPRVFVVAGDWHGNTAAVRRACQSAEQLQSPVVVQLGDFGLWPGAEGERYIERVSKTAAKTGVVVAWVDGNHEDFAQLADTPVTSDGLQWQAERVCRIPRGSRWVWHGVRFAALGGAVSVDRSSRIPGRSWWDGESITDADLSRLASGGPCDVLLAHDCPAGVDIPGVVRGDYASALASGWSVSDMERAWEHRERLLEAVRSTTPAQLWHGHYHVRHSASVSLHSAGITRVEGLSWDGDSLERSTAAVFLSDGEAELRSIRSSVDLEVRPTDS